MISCCSCVNFLGDGAACDVDTSECCVSATEAISDAEASMAASGLFRLGFGSKVKLTLSSSESDRVSLGSEMGVPGSDCVLNPWQAEELALNCDDIVPSVPLGDKYRLPHAGQSSHLPVHIRRWHEVSSHTTATSLITAVPLLSLSSLSSTRAAPSL